MRIVPNGIEPHNEELVGRGECPHFDVADTIKITDAQWNEIGTDWVKSGGHKKWLVGVEGGKFHYEQVKPFSQYLKELIQLSLQSSAALSNLMGKFPDLPDEVTE